MKFAYDKEINAWFSSLEIYVESFTKCENERLALVLLKEKEKGEKWRYY